MDSIRLFIERFTPLSDNDWATIASHFTPYRFEEGSLLLEEGSVCRYLYFLESGLLRFFTWRNGNDVTKYFTDAPYFFTSQRSFTEEIPAADSIQAIEDSKVWLITFESAHALFSIEAWSTFVRKLVQEVQYYTEQLLSDMQLHTAEERYKRMLATNPQFLQRIPLKYLASYFGIAPQSLSRIRKKILVVDRK